MFGSRFASAGQRKILLYWHGVANQFLTWLTNILNDINLTDMETCYKAVRADILKQTPLYSNRFGIEPELTTKLAQWNIRLYEVPISYHGRSVAEGKKIGWKDAVLGDLDADPLPLPRRSLHDARRLLRAPEHAPRPGPEQAGSSSSSARSSATACSKRAAGIGNFTELLLDRERLVCVDNDPLYVEMANWRLGHLENIRTLKADLSDTAFYPEIKDERIDTIICLNVLEHIAPDEQVLRAYYDLLEPGGHAIILVPAHPCALRPVR